MTEVSVEAAPSILSKAFDILNAFNSRDRVMTLTEIADASGHPKSTVHRLIARLLEVGALERHRDGYRIGLATLRWAAAAPAVDMRELALPHLASLQRYTGHTVHLAVRRGFNVVYLEKLPRGSLGTLAEVGSSLPANCTAAGKALVAFEDPVEIDPVVPAALTRLTPKSVVDSDRFWLEINSVRRTGFAEQFEEGQVGRASIATPVIVNHVPIAAISIGYRIEGSLPPGTRVALREAASVIGAVVRANLAGPRANLFPRDP